MVAPIRDGATSSTSVALCFVYLRFSVIHAQLSEIGGKKEGLATSVIASGETSIHTK